MACFRPLTNLACWSTTTEAQSIRQPVSFAPDCLALKVRRTVLSLICGSELSQLLRARVLNGIGLGLRLPGSLALQMTYERAMSCQEQQLLGWSGHYR